MRLLLVEDDIPLADAMARGLRREGFAVDVAGDDQIVEAAVLDAHGGSIEWDRADGHVVARATLPGDLSQPGGGGRHVGMVSRPSEGSRGDRRSEVVA